MKDGSCLADKSSLLMDSSVICADVLESLKMGKAMESKGEGVVQGRSRRMPEEEDGTTTFT
jgi:hypothetical protein